MVDRLLFDERSNEELEILSTEVANYLKYYSELVIPALERNRQHYVDLLWQLDTPGLTASFSSHLYLNSETISFSVIFGLYVKVVSNI